MKKRKNYYYNLLKQESNYLVQSIKLIVNLFNNYSYLELLDIKKKILNFKNISYNLVLEIYDTLVIEFMTEIDQEDLLRLFQGLNNIQDSLYEIIEIIYIYNIRKIDEDIKLSLDKLYTVMNDIDLAIIEFKNYKQSSKLQLIFKNFFSEKIDNNDHIIHKLYNITCLNINDKDFIAHTFMSQNIYKCNNLCKNFIYVLMQVIIKHL